MVAICPHCSSMISNVKIELIKAFKKTKDSQLEVRREKCEG